MTATPSPTALPPIPVHETVRAAWQVSKANWRELLKIMLLPAIVLVITGTGLYQPGATPKDFQTFLAQASHSWPMTLMSMVAHAIISPWVSVAGLRYLVLGEESQAWWPNYNGRMWRYLWKNIVVGFATAAPLLIGSLVIVVLLSIMGLPQPSVIFVSAIGFLVLLFFVLLLGVRIFIAIPATAITDDNRLKVAFQKTRGQIVSIGSIQFFASLTMILPFILLWVGTVVVNVIVGTQADAILEGITTGATFIIGQIIFLPVNALLYKHFYSSPAAPNGESLGQ